MKLLLYFVFFIAVVPFASAPDDFGFNAIGGNGVFPLLRECSRARFCGSEDLGCNYVRDNVCPENYGDWNLCQQNNYNGSCSSICDPDCGYCGQNVALNVPNSNSSSQFPVKANAYGYSVGEDVGVISYSFSLFLVNSGGGLSSAGYSNPIDSCPNDVCSFQFLRTSPGSYCKTYNYAVKFYVRWTNGSSNMISMVSDLGRTTPSVSITRPDESNNFNVEAGCANGDAGTDVRIVVFYIEKRMEDGSYTRLNSQGQECQQNCQLSVRMERQGNYFVHTFDNTNFNNGDYRMVALAYSGILVQEGGAEEIDFGDYPPRVASVDFVIDKGLVGEVGGTYQGSKVLNIILARIKTWI